MTWSFHYGVEKGVTELTKEEKAIQYIQEKNYEEAAKTFIEIIEEDPDNPIGYVNFGNLLIQMQQLEEAERFLLKAIELDENAATAYYSLGNLYYDSNLFKEAEKMYQKTISLGLEDSDVYFMLGMTYVKRQYYQLAIPFLQRAVELKEDVDKLFQYGLALAQVDYLKEAESILLKVIEKDENHADALYNLGIIEVHRDQDKKAMQYFEKALASQPDHKLAENALHSLKSGK